MLDILCVAEELLASQEGLNSKTFWLLTQKLVRVLKEQFGVAVRLPTCIRDVLRCSFVRIIGNSD
jgi:hypothetical protein